MFPDIKPKEASLKLEIPYTKSFANSFYRMKNLPPNTTKKKSIPPQNTSQEHKFIDDPDELLMSVSVRELNRPNPDPRWANVLITTRKANIGQSKKEGKIRSRFKSMNIKDIAKILSERPQDTLPKQDLKESS